MITIELHDPNTRRPGVFSERFPTLGAETFSGQMTPGDIIAALHDLIDTLDPPTGNYLATITTAPRRNGAGNIGATTDIIPVRIEAREVNIKIG